MLATLVLALLVSYRPRTLGQAPSSKESAELAAKLSARVPNYTVTAGNFTLALMKVAGEFKVPMGIEWIRTPSAMKRVQLSLKNTTVRALIERITQLQPGYEVAVKHAVIHVYPRNRVPDRQNFLTVRIQRFDVQNQVAEIASKRLYAIANSTIVPPRPGGPRGGTGGSQGVEVGDPEISVSLENTSVRNVLDALAQVSPFKIWLVTFAGDQSLTPTGFRRTVSPVTGKAVPDDEQPVWELLRWGRKPY